MMRLPSSILGLLRIRHDSSSRVTGIKVSSLILLLFIDVCMTPLTMARTVCRRPLAQVWTLPLEINQTFSVFIDYRLTVLRELRTSCTSFQSFTVMRGSRHFHTFVV